MTISRAVLALAASLLLAVQARAVELVMVEQAGCYWCEQWNEEIGGIYHKTDEGAFAPLRRVDLFALPSDLETARRVNYTPTFLLVDNNREIARLEGYPGDDFFWFLLDKMLKEHAGYVAPQG